MANGIDPSKLPECEEGPEAAKQFQRSMRQIISVSKEELQRRETTYKRQRARKKKSRTTA